MYYCPRATHALTFIRHIQQPMPPLVPKHIIQECSEQGGIMTRHTSKCHHCLTADSRGFKGIASPDLATLLCLQGDTSQNGGQKKQALERPYIQRQNQLSYRANPFLSCGIGSTVKSKISFMPVPMPPAFRHTLFLDITQ